MATEKAEIQNYEDLQRAGTTRRYQSLAIYEGPTPLYVWLVLPHPVSLFSNRFLTIYILKQKLLIAIGRHFFPQAIFTIECAADFVMSSGACRKPQNTRTRWG